MATTKQVYHDAGRALEAANLLETELGTSLLMLDALDTESYKNPDADTYKRLRAAIDSQTLGSSIGAIKKRLAVTDDLEGMFSQALEARNFLVHRLFLHYGMKIHDPAGREEMLARIGQLYDTIWNAYTAASHLSQGLVAAVHLLAKQETCE